jgi:hypothetical protein
MTRPVIPLNRRAMNRPGESGNSGAVHESRNHAFRPHAADRSCQPRPDVHDHRPRRGILAGQQNIPIAEQLYLEYTTEQEE